jgi:hypothetical protein
VIPLPSPAAELHEDKWRKLSAHALLEDPREIYVRCGRRALLLRLLATGTATVDDVRAVVELPPGINPMPVGAVPGPLAHAGVIEAIG